MHEYFERAKGDEADADSSLPSVSEPAGLDAEEVKTYDKVRRSIQKLAGQKISPKYRKAVDLLLFLPDFVVLIFRLMKDERVPAVPKVKLALFMAYLASPIDLVPDFIPVLGQMDDLVAAVLAVRAVLRATPPEIVLEHWSGEADVIKTTQTVLDVAGDLLGKNVIAAISKFLRATLIRGSLRRTSR